MMLGQKGNSHKRECIDLVERFYELFIFVQVW